MQMTVCRMDTLEKELRALNFDSKAVALISESNQRYLIKLHRIPTSAVQKLAKEVRSHGAEIFFPRKEHTNLTVVGGLLIGTLKQLSGICSDLKLQPGILADLGSMLCQNLERLCRKPPMELRLGEYRLPLGERTLLMGILNVTPDSFSDGGQHYQLEQALSHAHEMAAEGADIIDIGGESTRPGSRAISASEELGRVLPVIKALKKDQHFKTPLSIDTYKPEVAQETLQAGVEMLNDVWGLKENPSLGAVAASFGVPICLMHNRRSTNYRDLIPDIISELLESIELALLAGIDDRQIIIDPGIGFGKDLQQNLEVMQHLSDFCHFGYPLLLGTSRKSMIGKLLDLPTEDRLEGTAATVAFGISAGVDIIRVHDVRQMRRVASMTDAIVRR